MRNDTGTAAGGWFLLIADRPYVRTATGTTRRNDHLIGVTIDQCRPTGQRCTRQGPSRTEVSEKPGIHVVVNVCPSRQRTSTLPAHLPVRARRNADSAAVATIAIAIARRRLSVMAVNDCMPVITYISWH